VWEKYIIENNGLILFKTKAKGGVGCNGK